jgi:hypothetical protein
MGYASTAEIEVFLAQALTTARPNSAGRIELINIGTYRDENLITDDIMDFFASTGDEQIDGALSQMYETPLKRCVSGQWNLDADIDVYNQVIEINDTAQITRGDMIIIRDDNTGIEELHVVNQVVDQNRILTVDPIENEFSGDEVRIMRLKFPPPVSQISARLAAAYIYDKYFASQNSPNISEYGKEMRRVAYGQLNDILNGRIILECQRRIGDLFGNSYLDDLYALRDRGFNSGERNLSNSDK